MPRHPRTPFVVEVAPTTFHEYLTAREVGLPERIVGEALSRMVIPRYVRTSAGLAALRALKTGMVGSLLDAGLAAVKAQATRIARDAALRSADPGCKAGCGSPFMHVVRDSGAVR